MSKIKISTVKMTCDAEVIGVSANFVAKAIRAADSAQLISDYIVSSVKDRISEDDLAINWYNQCIHLGALELQGFMEKIAPFLLELRDALLEEV